MHLNRLKRAGALLLTGALLLGGMPDVMTVSRGTAAGVTGAVVTSVSTSGITTVHAASKKGWQKGKKQYFKNGEAATGLTKIGKKYYFFNNKGILKTGDFTADKQKYFTTSEGVIEGIKYKKAYYYPNGKKMTADDSYEFDTYLRARAIVKKITTKKMSKSQKLMACMKWVQSHPYKMYGQFSPDKRWTARVADQVMVSGGSDCHGDAAAFGYMAVAIGYTNVYVCIDSNGLVGVGGHSWTEIGGKVYDPLFAEARGFSEYYGVSYGNYVLRAITHRKILYGSASHAGKKAMTLPKNGLVKASGGFCFYRNGSKVKNQWKTLAGRKYYFTKSGKAATGTRKIDGKIYVFSGRGVYSESDTKTAREKAAEKEKQSQTPSVTPTDTTTGTSAETPEGTP